MYSKIIHSVYPSVQPSTPAIQASKFQNEIAIAWIGFHAPKIASLFQLTCELIYGPHYYDNM